MNGQFPFEKTAAIQEVRRIYCARKVEIVARLDEFNCIWETGNEETIFAELIFCLLTPQSKAKSCWAAVQRLIEKKLMLVRDKDQLAEELNGVRFKYKKAQYIVEASRQFSADGGVSIKPRIRQFSDVCDMREWLVRNVKGMGYKEASHFLRNIGFGEEIAILDRHILKNLRWLGVIGKIPTHLTKARYFDIESKMAGLAIWVDIPMHHLDLVLWCKETGEIFK